MTMQMMNRFRQSAAVRWAAVAAALLIFALTFSTVAAFDAHKNFARSTVLTAPSPATSGTTLVVQSGDGAKFPTPPFNATVGPANTTLTPANSEIVRVTNISTDTFTITRAQESTSPISITVGMQIFNAATAKTFTDVEAAAYMGLIHAGSGSSSAAGATVLDSTSISGLTAKDSLDVFITCASVTQATAQACDIHNSTDPVNILNEENTASAGTTFSGQMVLRQSPVANTKVIAFFIGADQAATSLITGNLATFITAWTGAWTLTIQHNGVTSGGTFYWSWAVYKVIGQ